MTAALILLRHGETRWNREGRYQGHADPPLSATGWAQARQAAAALRHLRLEAVYSSDRRRALDTAAVLAQAQGLPVQVDARLRELSFGEWEGRPAAQVWATDRERQEAWYADPLHRAPPGGETVWELWQRMQPALAAIARAHPGAVAVVTHGGVIKVVLAWLLTGMPWTTRPWPAVAPPGGWVFLSSWGSCSLTSRHRP